MVLDAAEVGPRRRRPKSPHLRPLRSSLGRFGAGLGLFSEHTPIHPRRPHRAACSATRPPLARHSPVAAAAAAVVDAPASLLALRPLLLLLLMVAVAVVMMGWGGCCCCFMCLCCWWCGGAALREWRSNQLRGISERPWVPRGPKAKLRTIAGS